MLCPCPGPELSLGSEVCEPRGSPAPSPPGWSWPRLLVASVVKVSMIRSWSLIPGTFPGGAAALALPVFPISSFGGEKSSSPRPPAFLSIRPVTKDALTSPARGRCSLLPSPRCRPSTDSAHSPHQPCPPSEHVLSPSKMAHARDHVAVAMAGLFFQRSKKWAVAADHVLWRLCPGRQAGLGHRRASADCYKHLGRCLSTQRWPQRDVTLPPCLGRSARALRRAPGLDTLT